MSDSDSSSAASSSEDENEDTKLPLQQPPAKKKARVDDTTISTPLELAPAVASTEQQRREARSANKVIVLLDQARLETIKNRYYLTID